MPLMIVIEALDDGGKGRNVASRLVPTALAARQLFVQVSRPSPGGTVSGERCRFPDIRQAAIDVDPPQGRVAAPIAAAGARVSRRFFEFFAVNVRNPHTRRA